MARPRNSANAETTADEKAGAASVAPAGESVEENTQAAADAQAEAESDEGSVEAGYRVTGAAVVLRTVDGAERYLYRGARVPSGAFLESSIEHAVSVGLIASAE